MIQFDKEWLAFMRDLFPKGTQIQCSSAKGRVPALSGELGAVEYIDDSGIFHCALEDGRTLVAAIDEGCFRVDLREQTEPVGKERQLSTVDAQRQESESPGVRREPPFAENGNPERSQFGKAA